MPFHRVIGPVRVHVDNKGIIDGLYEMEKVSVLSKQREMLIYGLKFGKNYMKDAFW